MTCSPAFGIADGGVVVFEGLPDPQLGDALIDTRTTTDATTQTLTIANLPIVGAGVYWYLSIRGQETNGQRGARFNYWADASRNAVGTNGVVLGTVGPTGYTDVATPPWTTIAVPVGWGFTAINIVGNQTQFQFNGAVAQTVQWKTIVQRIFMSGATP
jgi:hypothetical protein